MTKAIGGYSPETAKIILEVVQYLRANGFVIAGGQKKPHESPVDQATPPLYFQNTTGETVPPYGCMEITGTVEANGRNYFTVKKPDDEWSDGPFLFNLHKEVKANDYSIGDFGVEFRSLSAASGADAGKRFGPTEDSFSLQEQDAGQFLQCGPDDLAPNTARLCLSARPPADRIIFQINDDTLSTDEVGPLCADQPYDAPSSVRATVVRRPCGIFDKVRHEDDDGFVTIHDDAAGGFFANRNAVDLQGKTGFAQLFEYGTEEEPDCRWVVTWINWFRTVQVEEDTIFGDNTITIERKNVEVWNDCDLPDEVIQGTDCEYY